MSFLLTKRGEVKGMLRVYHGTSYENGLRILDEGFKCEKKIWYVSDNDSVYFHYVLPDSKYEDEQDARRRAIDSARISSAINHSTSPHIYLFSIEVDEGDIEEFLDYSSENMSGIALEIPVDIVNKTIIQSEVVEDVYIPSLGLVYLAGLNLDYLNTENLIDEELYLLRNKKTLGELQEIYCELLF